MKILLQYAILFIYITNINSFLVSFPTLYNNKAIISNININKLTIDDKIELKKLFNIVPLLVFKNQYIDPTTHYNFCKIFDNKYNDKIIHPFTNTAIPDVPQIALKGNGYIKDFYGVKNQTIRNSEHSKYNYIWHQDLVGSKDHIPPIVSSIYMINTPPNGGNTLFASLEDAYDSMDYVMKKEVSKFNIIYSNSFKRTLESNYDYSGFIRKDETCRYNDDILSIKPFVIYSDNNKYRKALMTTSDRFMKFDKLSCRESNDLYRHIMKKYVLNKDNIIKHKWENNDLIIFNNRKLIHTASPTIEYQNHPRLFSICFLGTNEPIKRI